MVGKQGSETPPDTDGWMCGVAWRGHGGQLEASGGAGSGSRGVSASSILDTREKVIWEEAGGKGLTGGGLKAEVTSEPR